MTHILILVSYLLIKYEIFGVRNLSLRFLSVLICIRIANFSWGINNKRIIEFGFHRISEFFRPRSALSATPLLRQITLTLV